MASMKTKIRTMGTSTGTWRSSITLMKGGSDMPTYRKTTESDSDTEAEAIAAALVYYGRYVEPLLRALDFTLVLDIETAKKEE